MPLSRHAQEFKLLLNGVEMPELRLLSVTRSLGGANEDEARFELRPQRTTARSLAWFGNALSNLGNADVEVFELKPATRRIFWGRVKAQTPAFDQDSESVQYTARLSRYLLGLVSPPTHFTAHLREAIGSRQRFLWAAVDFRELIFNPVFDGKTWPNRHRDEPDARYIPPEALWRPNPTREDCLLWTLRDVVQFLSFLASPDVPVAVPLSADSLAKIPATPVRGLKVELYREFAEVLDELITPYGLTWMMDYTAPRPQLTIVDRNAGFGTTSIVKMQAPGAAVSTDETNVASLSLTLDVADRHVSQLAILGRTAQEERTIRLYPCWSQDYDSLPIEETAFGESTWLTTDGKQNAWRRWCRNESGEYSHLRDGLERHDISGSGDKAAIRRRIYPTITLDDNGDPIGRFQGIDFRWRHVDDPPDAAGEKQWRTSDDTPTSNIRVFDDEVGVYVTSDVASAEMYLAADGNPDNLEVEITGTFDAHLFEAFSSRVLGAYRTLDDAWLEYPKRVVLWKEELQHRYSVGKESRYFGSGKTENTINDFGDAADLVNRLALSWRRVVAKGTINLFGLDFGGRDLGFTVPAILPWGFSLSVGNLEGEAYPMIVGVTYDVQTQQTQLTLDSFMTGEVA